MAKKRKLFVAGNWKMNKLLADTESFFKEFMPKVSALNIKRHVDVLFACPMTVITSAKKLTVNADVKIAAQNFHWEQKGAFTGEVSISMLKDIGIEWSVVGHSERRQYFNETNDTMKKKLTSAQNAGFNVIACVGETLDQRQGNQTNKIIEEQMQAIIAGIKESPTKDLSKVVIAYEPVWAIGTRLSATAAQAVEVHQHIRSIWAKEFSTADADKVLVLYGGSVTPDNAPSLLGEADIDGALIGGASLKHEDFYKICETATKLF